VLDSLDTRTAYRVNVTADKVVCTGIGCKILVPFTNTVEILAPLGDEGAPAALIARLSGVGGERSNVVPSGIAIHVCSIVRTRDSARAGRPPAVTARLLLNAAEPPVAAAFPQDHTVDHPVRRRMP